MTDYLNQLLFGYYPYIAFTVFVVGSAARFEYAPYGWKSGSSQMLRKKYMKIGSNLFHISVIAILLGHFFGLLTPKEVYHLMMTSGAKQLAAMVSGGIFGVVCLVGMSLLLYRRLFDSRIRATSSFSDTLILIVLYIQLVLGLLTILASAKHLDGSVMVLLASWAQGIVTFQPNAASLMASQSIIFKLHILLGLTIFLIFPFTRLVHVWSIPVGYLLRTGYQIVRRKHSF